MDIQPTFYGGYFHLDWTKRDASRRQAFLKPRFHKDALQHKTFLPAIKRTLATPWTKADANLSGLPGIVHLAATGRSTARADLAYRWTRTSACSRGTVTWPTTGRRLTIARHSRNLVRALFAHAF